MATDYEKYADRVKKAVREGRLSGPQGQELINNAYALANRKGDFGAQDRKEATRQFRAAIGLNQPQPDGGTGGDDTDTGTGTDTGTDTGGTTQPNPVVDTTPYAARTSAREFLQDLFGQLGFSAADVTSLMSSVDGWISEGLADVGNEAILARFRTTDIYKNRFAGMEALRQRGQAISEAEYVQMERSYRRVLSSYGLPPEFYDNYDDYAKFIANDISANELEDRVSTAQALLQGSGEVLAELNEYYGVGEGEALAYLLDAEKAQKVIQRQVRAAQIGGAAERSGFSMGRSQSEQLASSTLGQTLDPFNPQTSAQLESTFARARRTANRERTLADIDQEAYTEMDTLQAAFGDDEKQLASERRARRERARFSGTAGAARSALSQSRNF